MRQYTTTSSIPDGDPIVQPGAIRRRDLQKQIQGHVTTFKNSPGYLRAYQEPNQVVSDRTCITIASFARRVTLAVMRIKGDPEALAEKRVRIEQQSNKSS